MARLGFNANEVAPDTGGGPLPESGPEGYVFQVIEEELKSNSKGTGDVLSLTFEVIEGEFHGRKLWVTMNTAHNNPVAQGIGQGQLSALCHAMGYMQVDDSQELLWKPFRATTKIDVEEYNGRDRERAAIKKYISVMDGDVPAAKAPARGAPVGRATAPPTRQPPARSGPGNPAAGRTLPWGQGRQQAAIDEDIPF